MSISDFARSVCCLPGVSSAPRSVDDVGPGGLNALRSRGVDAHAFDRPRNLSATRNSEVRSRVHRLHGRGARMVRSGRA